MVLCVVVGGWWCLYWCVCGVCGGVCHGVGGFGKDMKRPQFTGRFWFG